MFLYLYILIENFSYFTNVARLSFPAHIASLSIPMFDFYYIIGCSLYIHIQKSKNSPLCSFFFFDVYRIISNSIPYFCYFSSHLQLLETYFWLIFQAPAAVPGMVLKNPVPKRGTGFLS